MKIFGKEPALLLGLVAVLIQTVSVFLHVLTDEQQGVLNGVVVAVVGLATAWKVDTGKLAPAILGLAQATLAVYLGFGGHLAAEQQAVLMALVTTVVAMFVRTQVTAPVRDVPQVTGV